MDNEILRDALVMAITSNTNLIKVFENYSDECRYRRPGSLRYTKGSCTNAESNANICGFGMCPILFGIKAEYAFQPPHETE